MRRRRLLQVPLNVSDAARLMNIDVVLAKKPQTACATELFNAAAMKDGRAVLRRTDIDSGNVIGIRTYNDYDQAEKELPADAVRVADQAQEAAEARGVAYRPSGRRLCRW